MNGSIEVNPEETISAGQSIIQNAETYMQEINKVYSYMDELKGSWAGEKASQFIEGVNRDREEFEQFGKDLKTFGLKIEDIGKDYQRLEM